MVHPKDFPSFTSVTEARTLHVFGEVDIANGPEFETAVRVHASQGSEVVIDLTKCSYMDSTGLAVLARASKRFPNLAACRVKTKSSVARVMEITNFDDILTVEVED